MGSIYVFVKEQRDSYHSETALTGIGPSTMALIVAGLNGRGEFSP